MKEVEKIKQKRDERRALQHALRAHQDLEYDTTAPNWEFGAMIRFAKYVCAGSSTNMLLSPSNIIWYWRKGCDAVWLRGYPWIWQKVLAGCRWVYKYIE